jgi:hypothetical protein
MPEDVRRERLRQIEEATGQPVPSFGGQIDPPAATVPSGEPPRPAS